MLDILVPHVVLYCPGILTIVGQFVASRMPQHVRVYRKADFGILPGSLNHLPDIGISHGTATLSDEQIRGIRVFP